MGLAPPVSAALDAVSGQSGEQNAAPPPSQIPAQPVSALLASVTPPSQPVPAAMALTPPIPSMANVVASASHPAASSTADCAVSSALPEIKQEASPMDTSKPGSVVSIKIVLNNNNNKHCCIFINLWTFSSPAPPSGAPVLSVPAADLTPGASPRKKPRKQQHVISTEDSEMMETNSTDEEKPPAKPVRPEKRKSPPKEYIGQFFTTCVCVSRKTLHCSVYHPKSKPFFKSNRLRSP